MSKEHFSLLFCRGRFCRGRSILWSSGRSILSPGKKCCELVHSLRGISWGGAYSPEAVHVAFNETSPSSRLSVVHLVSGPNKPTCDSCASFDCETCDREKTADSFPEEELAQTIPLSNPSPSGQSWLEGVSVPPRQKVPLSSDGLASPSWQCGRRSLLSPVSSHARTCLLPCAPRYNITSEERLRNHLPVSLIVSQNVRFSRQ